MNGTATGVYVNNSVLIGCMNLWFGKKFFDSFDEFFLIEKQMN